MSDVVGSILEYNANRDAARVAIKYRLMRQDPFSFMRGTCHLYYQDSPIRDSVLNEAPIAWISGDLHLENFGCYKGDNRLIYFDLNDFDEAVLAPATWELGRWLASILVAADALQLPREDALQLCRIGLASYSEALRTGKGRWLERDTAKGMIRSLLDPMKLRDRKTFLDSRTCLHKGRRQIEVDGKRAFALDPQDKQDLMTFVEAYAYEQSDPDFYRPLDAARRIAGTGSLGIDRYVILIEGRGGSEENFLLDLKQAIPSALSPYVKHKQPDWVSEAHRVVSVQRWAQAIAPAFLSAVMFQGRPFVFKGLQPTQDKLKLTGWNGKLKRLDQVIRSMGEIVAWSHLRSGGRCGSAITDQWVVFGEQCLWQTSLINDAIIQAEKAEADWKKYCVAFDRSGKSWC